MPLAAEGHLTEPRSAVALNADKDPRHGDDRAVLAHRLVQVIGGGGLALGAAALLPPAEAGLFFLLLSLLGAQALLDAGSSIVLVSFVGRAMRHLRWSTDDRPLGSVAAQARLDGLTRLGLAWGLASAGVALAILLPAVWVLLDLQPEAARLDPTRAITISTVAALALYQLGAAVPLVLEGSGRVREVARMRTRVDLLSYLVACSCLLAGHGLWSPAVLWALRAAATIAWSLPRARTLLCRPGGRWLRWRLAAMAAPMQRRLALSWTAGYITQQCLVPLSFVLLGPEDTGRIGLGLFLVNGVSMMATAPLSARTPELSRLGAARHWVAFDALRRQALRRALGASLAGHAAVLAGVAIGSILSATAATRLPAVSWLLLLVPAALAGTVVQGIATSLRACGREPFLALTLVGAVLLPVALAAGALEAGATGFCLAYLLVSGGVGLPWSVWLLRRFEAGRLTGA